MYIEKISDYMQATKFDSCLIWHCCYFDGRLSVLPSNHTNQPHKIFFNYSSITLMVGFDVTEWNSIDREIMYFLEGVKHGKIETSRPIQIAKANPDPNDW